MTSRFAPVAPVAVHQRLMEADALGDYHLLLAHQVLAQPAVHEGFYRGQLPKYLARGKGHTPTVDPYIIMDNSLIELGYPLPMADVIAAAEIVKARIVVLPDVLGDRIATLNKSAAAAIELDRLRASSPYARSVRMLGVAQGHNEIDVFSCARDMIQHIGVEMVSIPRHVTAKVGTRVKLVQMVTRYGKPVHLLGFSDNLFDDMSALSIRGVTGIDSAVPIWYGLQGFKLPVEPPVNADYGKRPTDYEQQTEINQDVIQNIRRVERWASIAKDARTRR